LKEVVDSAEEKEIEIRWESHLQTDDNTEGSTVGDDVYESLPPYDPRKDLEYYKFPTIDLLKKYVTGDQQIDMEEHNANKDRIVKILADFGVKISVIRATVGPTVTLYEVTPAPGVRISKIKTLSDDIALAISAIGVHIIAPIPGKGTIGIEVPNKKPNKRNDKRDVFLCHSIYDIKIVKELIALFEKNHITYFDDKEATIQSEGLDCDSLLKRRIMGAKVIVFLSSEHSAKSDNVKPELRFAMRCHKPLIVLKLDTTPYPSEFAGYLNFSPKIDTTFYNRSVEKTLIELITCRL